MTHTRNEPAQEQRQNNRLWWLLLLLLLLLLLALLCAWSELPLTLFSSGQEEEGQALVQAAPAQNEPPQASAATLTTTATSTATLMPSATATEASQLACEGIRGISFIDGIGMRVQVDFPGIPEGEYSATVNSSSISCTTYEEYSDRLFCDGPKPEEGSLASISILDGDGNIVCMETFNVPVAPTATPKGLRDDDPSDPLSGGGGSTCQEPAGGCNAAQCEFWDQASCSCVLDPSCIN